jgi:hypothetical protein
MLGMRFVMVVITYCSDHKIFLEVCGKMLYNRSIERMIIACSNKSLASHQTHCFAQHDDDHLNAVAVA